MVRRKKGGARGAAGGRAAAAAEASGLGGAHVRPLRLGVADVRGRRNAGRVPAMQGAQVADPGGSPHFRHGAQMPPLRTRMEGAESGEAVRVPGVRVAELGQAPEIPAAHGGRRALRASNARAERRKWR